MSKKKNKTKITLSKASELAKNNIAKPNTKDSFVLQTLYKKELVEKRTLYIPTFPYNDDYLSIIRERKAHFSDYYKIADEYTKQFFSNYKTEFGINSKYSIKHLPNFIPFSKRTQVLPFPYEDDFRKELLNAKKYKLCTQTLTHGTNGRKTEESTFFLANVRGEVVLFREIIYRQSLVKDNDYTEANNSYQLQAIICGNINGPVDLFRVSYKPHLTQYNRLVALNNNAQQNESIEGSCVHTLNKEYSVLLPTLYFSCDAIPLETKTDNFEDLVLELRAKNNLDTSKVVLQDDRYPIKEQFSFFMKKENKVISEDSQFVSELPIEPVALDSNSNRKYISMYLNELARGRTEYDLKLPLLKKTAEILQHRIDNMADYEKMLDSYIKKNFASDYKENFGIRDSMTLDSLPEMKPFNRDQQIYAFPMENSFREECIECMKYQILPTEFFSKTNKRQKSTFYIGKVQGKPCLFFENIRYKVDEDGNPLSPGYSYSLSILLGGKQDGYMELLRTDFMPLSAHPNKMLANGELNTYDNVNLYSLGDAVDIVYGSHLHKLTKRYSIVYPTYPAASDAVEINDLVHSYQEMIEYTKAISGVQDHTPFMEGKNSKQKIVDCFEELLKEENSDNSEDNLSEE